MEQGDKKMTIYDVGIKLLKSGQLPARDTLDLSVFGYDWETEKHLRGKKHNKTIQEIADMHVNIYNWICKWPYYAMQLDKPPVKKIIESIKTDPFFCHWDMACKIIPIDTLINLGLPKCYYPDTMFPYRNLSDTEILSIVSDLNGLSGNRTTTGINKIREMVSPAPELSEIHVIYKKTWRESKTDIRIGQTNGSMGRCKNACFISWKINQ